MAIGAKPGHIMVQFLGESVMMCLISGLIGTLIAAFGAWAVNQTGKITMSVSGFHVLIAVFFSTTIGLFFGFYPARRAAGLLPI
ncbi:FtsX-like permease family protein, partial [Acinetobacter baumannii]